MRWYNDGTRHIIFIYIYITGRRNIRRFTSRQVFFFFIISVLIVLYNPRLIGERECFFFFFNVLRVQLIESNNEFTQVMLNRYYRKRNS